MNPSGLWIYRSGNRCRTSCSSSTHDVEEALVLAQRVHVLAPNPGRIIRSLDVDLDKTDLDQLRLSSDFLSMRRSLSATMRELEPALS